MRILKYMIFLVTLLVFMVFLGHKDTLSPQESLDIADFQNKVALEQTTPNDAVALGSGSGQATSSTSSTSHESPSIGSQTIPNGTVLAESLNVRSGPGLDYPVISILYKGDVVIIGEKHDEWYELILEGRIVYVAAEYIAVSPI